MPGFSCRSEEPVKFGEDDFPIGRRSLRRAVVSPYADASLQELHWRVLPDEAVPDFEILGLFVLLLIGFVLFLEGGHVAHMTVNGGEFPYIPQWIVIFILLLMFAVYLYQNWLERKIERAPVAGDNGPGLFAFGL